MLFLSAKDIDSVIEVSAMIDAIEEAYHIQASGDYTMPQRMHVDHGKNTLLLMPCLADRSLSTKLVTVYTGNADIDTPVINGMVILSDGSTGEPLAVMDGAKLTAHRTGAVGGVAFRYLGNKEIKKIGLVGAGVQGYHQLLYTCSETAISEVLVYDANPERLSEFISNIDIPVSRITESQSAQKLVEEVDLIITATSSQEPVLPDKEGIYTGKTIIAVGSYRPDMRELPQKFFEVCDRIFVDTMHAIMESGDINDPYKNRWYRNDMLPMAELVTGNTRIRENEHTLLFKSVGMALFDNVAARLLYREALQKGIGTEINL